MADIFQQPALFRVFREFCAQMSPEVGDRFQRSVDEWDPHILLLLNGLLFVGQQLKGHSDQRFDEFLQQLVYHYAPGEAMARPGAHVLHIQTDETRFEPGSFPYLEPYSALRDDNDEPIGHIGDKGFSLSPGLSVERVEASQGEEGLWSLRFSLHSVMPIKGPMPAIQCFLLDGPNERNYRFLDLLWSPGGGCRRRGVSVRPTPALFRYLWSRTPWYEEQLRHLSPYPGELDLLFSIEGLTPEHWEKEGGGWRTTVDYVLPYGASIEDPSFLSDIKIVPNALPVFGYAQIPDVVLKGVQQDALPTRAEDVIWLRAWDRNQALYQPGLLYLGEIMEQEEPQLWFWTPADGSPLIAELRSDDKEIRLECLMLKRHERLWRSEKLENVRFDWDASAKQKKKFNAGCTLYPVGHAHPLKRVALDELREKVWCWMAHNFLLTENTAHLVSFLKQNLAEIGLADLALSHTEGAGAQVQFGHVPGRGLVPVFEVGLGLPEDASPGRWGHPLRGKAWCYMHRFALFFQERLPPHLQLVMSLLHQGHEGRPWSIRGGEHR